PITPTDLPGCAPARARATASSSTRAPSWPMPKPTCSSAKTKVAPPTAPRIGSGSSTATPPPTRQPAKRATWTLEKRPLGPCYHSQLFGQRVWFARRGSAYPPTGRSPWVWNGESRSHLRRQDVRLAVVARQHAVGFGVLHEAFLGR